MSVALGRRSWPVIAGICGIALTTAIYLLLLDVRNAAIVSTSFLLIVLLVAASSTLAAAIITSLVAMVCLQLLLPAAGTHAHHRRSAELDGTVCVPRRQPRRQQPFIAGAGTGRGGPGPTGRARAPLRPESGRTSERGLARGHRRRRTGHCATVRPRRGGPGAASGTRHVGRRAGRIPHRGLAAGRSLGGVAGGAAAYRVRCACAHIRGASLVVARRSAPDVGPAARRDAPHRPAGRRERPRRRRHAGRHCRTGGAGGRTHPVARGATHGRAHPPERGTQDDVARIDRARPADAADGDPRRRREPEVAGSPWRRARCPDRVSSLPRSRDSIGSSRTCSRWRGSILVR